MILAGIPNYRIRTCKFVFIKSIFNFLFAFLQKTNYICCNQINNPMKKLIFTIAVSMFFLSIFETTAQVSPPSSWIIDHSWSPPKVDTLLFKAGVNTPDRSSNWYDCPPNSVFGQEFVPDSILYAFFSVLFTDGTDTIAESIVFDDFYGVNSNVKGISFWGLLFGDSSLLSHPTTQDFMVMLWTDSTTLPQYFTVSAQGKPYFIPVQIDTIYDTIPVYNFTANFPDSIVLDSGFISILQIIDTNDLNNPNDFALFAWMASPEGNQMSIVAGVDIYGDFYDDLTEIPIDFAFCFTDYKLIPLKNWAIYFAILLIIGLALYRFRRRYI